MSIVRYQQQGPRQADSAEIKHMFDHSFQNGEGDESSVATSQWAPSVDIKEETGRFVMFADLPGVDSRDIEVQMDQGILSIKGERNSEIAMDAERFSRVERRHGSFHRRFALPDSADAEKVSATGCHGVLEISIPKKPESTPRRIQVGDTSNGAADTVQ